MDDSRNAHDTLADGDDTLDPREAASLLERTGREAQRQFTTETPLLSLISALIILIIYGAIWLSVRGQHPYRGPSLGTIGLVYLLVAVTVLMSAAVYVRATAGIKGRSRREDHITAIPLVVAVIGSMCSMVPSSTTVSATPSSMGCSTPQLRGSLSAR